MFAVQLIRHLLAALNGQGPGGPDRQGVRGVAVAHTAVGLEQKGGFAGSGPQLVQSRSKAGSAGPFEVRNQALTPLIQRCGRGQIGAMRDRCQFSPTVPVSPTIISPTALIR